MLSADLTDLLSSKLSPFISALFSPPEPALDSDANSSALPPAPQPGMLSRRGRGGGLMASGESQSGQFRKQLRRLHETVAATQPHYVRCVNPNAHKRPGVGGWVCMRACVRASLCVRACLRGMGCSLG